MTTLAPPPPIASESTIESPRALFLPYQQDWILDESPIAHFEKSRRIGADFTEAFRAVRDRVSGRRNFDYWYSSADESAAREFMIYVQSFANDLYRRAFEIIEGEEMIDDKSVKVMSIELPAVRGRRPRISAMTSNPRAFRSKGGDVTLSELAHHDDPFEMWKAAFPCTTWGGQLRTISTHKGEESWFNKLCDMARRHADPETHGRPKLHDVKASLHRVTLDDAIGQGLVERINQTSGTDFTREGFRDHLRRGCATEEIWEEEYLCRPSREAGRYFPHALLRGCISRDCPLPTDTLQEFIAQVGERAAPNAPLYVGIDVGRKRDLFVIWVVERIHSVKRTVGVLWYQDRKFSAMKLAARAIVGARFPGGARVVRCCQDATGIGMQLGEELHDEFRSIVEPVTYTADVKNELFTRLRSEIEDRTTFIPDDEVVLHDFNTVRKTTTATGAVRFDAERGESGHADFANACALAIHAAEHKRPAMRFVDTPKGVW